MSNRLVPYGRFLGLDTTTAVENMNERYLSTCANAYVDFRGQIVKGPGANLVEQSPASGGVVAIAHFGLDDLAYFYKDGANISARSTTGRSLSAAFSGLTIIPDFTGFTGKLVANVKDQQAVVYDGTAFARNASIPQGGCNTTVLNRLVVSDLSSNDTLVKASKLDNLSDFTTGAGSTDGIEIDIKNQLTNKDKVRGLGNLEGDKVAIFCQNETLVYSANTNATLWTIVRDFRVPIGTIGRNTIQPVGVDLFFSSKFGVHSLRRAASGLTLETIQLSRIVASLYQDLVHAMPEGSEPFAVWNPNLGQYTLFFPTNTDPVRLVFTYEPFTGKQASFQSWSQSSNDALACASYYAGSLRCGSNTGGVYDGEDTDASVSMQVKTPILWQGVPTFRKQYRRLFVRASGSAQFMVKAYNEEGRLLQTTTHQPAPPTTFDQTIPSRAPERPISIPFVHKCYGVQLEFLCAVSGTLKLLDFALAVEG